jgi:hypothetical protein
MAQTCQRTSCARSMTGAWPGGGGSGVLGARGWPTLLAGFRLVCYRCRWPPLIPAPHPTLPPSSIVHNEIKMKDEGSAAAGTGAESGGAGALLRNNMLMNALWSIVGGQRPHVSMDRLDGILPLSHVLARMHSPACMQLVFPILLFLNAPLPFPPPHPTPPQPCLPACRCPQASNEPTDEAVRGTLDSLHERAKGATFVVAREPDTVGRPVERRATRAGHRRGAVRPSQHSPHPRPPSPVIVPPIATCKPLPASKLLPSWPTCPHRHAPCWS